MRTSELEFGESASPGVVGRPSAQPTYDLGGLLHRGRSEVFRARHRRLGRDVVVKRYDLDLDRAAVLRRVGRVTSSCHPHTAGLIDVGTSRAPRPSVFLVREFFEGVSLARKMQEGLLFYGEALDALALQIVASLGEAHGRGLVHGALCPEHVLMARVGADEFAKVLDYEGTALGLPRGAAAEAYAPPGAPASLRADIQSLGMLLRAAATGDAPRWAPRTWPEPIDPRSLVLERAIRGEIGDAATFAEALRAARLSERGRTGAGTPSRGVVLGGFRSLAEEPPTVWLFADAPGINDPSLASAWAAIRARLSVVTFDAAGRQRALDALQTGRIELPWLIVFSDLHVLLGEPLLAYSEQSAETGRMLVSTHPNFDLLEATVNGCGLDRQVCLPLAPHDVVEAVDETLELVRRRRAHYDRLRLSIRNERARVEAITRRMAGAER